MFEKQVLDNPLPSKAPMGFHTSLMWLEATQLE